MRTLVLFPGKGRQHAQNTPIADMPVLVPWKSKTTIVLKNL
jgi:NAD/NADP transhydrogenase beta subunit